MKRKSTKTCRLCNKDGHNVGGPKCKKRKKYGSLVPENEVGQLMSNLLAHWEGIFSFRVMLPGCQKIEQLPKETNFLCIHAYVSEVPPVAGLSECTVREEFNYTCVTIFFISGVTLAKYKE